MTATPTDSRVALVSGASRGIGAAIATSLLTSGYRVAGLSTSGKAPEGVLAITCDITDPAAIDQAYAQVEAELGPVEILVANAGITRDGLLMRMSEQDWDEVIDVNLTGSYRLIRRAVRAMVKARFGRIVAISSVVGLKGSAGQVNYAASKSGLIGMCRSVARELGSRGITANVITPGFVQTQMTEVLDDSTQAAYLAQVPLGRPGQVDDIAAAVKFLVSDEAGYITGAILPVDGGLGMGY